MSVVQDHAGAGLRAASGDSEKDGAQPSGVAPRLGYLCGQYPAVSHTFVLREVLELRALGFEIDTFSIRRAGSDHLLARVDREEFKRTFALLPPRWGRLLAAHLKLLLKARRAYFATLRYSLGIAPAGWRGRVWQFFYFVEAVSLWSECSRRGIRHVHVHLANVAADVALLAAHLGCEIDHDDTWSWSFSMHGPTEFFDVSHFRLAEKLRRARFVVCISDFTRSQLMSLCEPEQWPKLHVVHCGVMVDHFNCDRDHAASLSGQAPSILCLGRLVPEKGQAVLLEATAELARRGRKVTVTFAGEGRSRADLEALSERLGVASQVSFVGAVGEDDLLGLYSHASIFCLPSFAEGVPGVLMEAMAMRLPVISTRIMGIPELVDDGENGLLVAPGRVEPLVEAIERLVDDPDLCARMGENGRRKVIEQFNTRRLGEQLYELFTRSLTAVRSEESDQGGGVPLEQVAAVAESAAEHMRA